MATTTVREALQFSALLRQPRTTPKAEKLEYVEEIIKLLEMEGYAEALVGEVGMGLNVEQRKRLTIGVELAAKPALLVFLDEPTSGLDSQSSWSIMLLLRKLADHGRKSPLLLLLSHFATLVLPRLPCSRNFMLISPSPKLQRPFSLRSINLRLNSSNNSIASSFFKRVERLSTLETSERTRTPSSTTSTLVPTRDVPILTTLPSVS